MPKKPIFIQDFIGMNQRQNVDRIADNESPLLTNISLDSPSVLMKRKGSMLTGNTLVSDQVDGLCVYRKSDGTQVARKFVNGDMYTYDAIADSWSVSIAAAYTAGTSVESVNYKDRMYHITTSDYLFYEDGTGVKTIVGSGANRLTGTDIATVQNTLYVLQNNRIYYSLFDYSWDGASYVTGANVPGDQFWQIDETGISNSTRFFFIPTRGVSLVGYKELLYIFTKRDCHLWDLRFADNALGVQKAFDIGIAGARAATTCNGILIFMDSRGKIHAFGGTGIPEHISYALEDDSRGDSIIENVDFANISLVSAGNAGNKFFFSIGTTSFHGELLTNAWIVGHIPQGFQSVAYSMYTFPWRAISFDSILISNKDIGIFGVFNTGDVYKSEVGSSDEGTAIAGKVKTKFFDFGKPLNNKTVNEMYVGYRPQSTDTPTYIAVKYAVDGDFTYRTLSDPVNSINTNGIINTASNSTSLTEVKRLGAKPEMSGRNISIELSNIQVDQDFEVSLIGFDIKTDPELDIRMD